MDKQSPDDIVVIGGYRKTRKRIRILAAASDKKMPDYLESIVPKVDT